MIDRHKLDYLMSLQQQMIDTEAEVRATSPEEFIEELGDVFASFNEDMDEVIAFFLSESVSVYRRQKLPDAETKPKKIIKKR